MRPDRKQLTPMYKSCVAPYEQLITSKWKWDKGEKPKILQSYITFCEAAGVRDPTQISVMIDAFLVVITERAKAWGKWKEASRSNYLGFVLQRDSLKLAGAKLNPDNQAKAEDFAIAGTQGAEGWDF